MSIIIREDNTFKINKTNFHFIIDSNKKSKINDHTKYDFYTYDENRNILIKFDNTNVNYNDYDIIINHEIDSIYKKIIDLFDSNNIDLKINGKIEVLNINNYRNKKKARAFYLYFQNKWDHGNYRYLESHMHYREPYDKFEIYIPWKQNIDDLRNNKFIYFNNKNEKRIVQLIEKNINMSIPKSSKKLDGKLRIFSWNTCWEAMQAKRSSKTDPTPHCNSRKNYPCYNLLNKYVVEIIEKYNPDFLVFQEASGTNSRDFNKELLNIPTNYNQYTSYTHESSSDKLITLYNKYNYKCENYIYGDTVKGKKSIKGGRPYLGLLLTNNNSGEKLLLINVHFPHKINRRTKEETRKKAEINLKNIISTYKNRRIIIAGDHNFNYRQNNYLKSEDKSSKKKKFYSNDNRPSTLPSKRQWDAVFDTKSKNITYDENVTRNCPRHNKGYVSDHLPILVELDY